jgi:hypothetical protein
MRRSVLGLILSAGLSTGCFVATEKVADPSPAFEAARQAAVRAGGTHGHGSRFHLLAYDPKDRVLTRVTLPLSLLTEVADAGLGATGERTLERLQRSDLRYAGRGLWLESEEEDGERVLLWVE